MVKRSKVESDLMKENQKLIERIAALENDLKTMKSYRRDRSSNENDKSDIQFRSLFTNAADGIIYLDKKANVIDVNPAITNITGILKSELVGKNTLDLARKFLKATDIPRVVKSLQQLLTGHDVKHFELDYKNVCLEISIFVDSNSNGLTAIFRDVTERKLSQIALRQSEERFRTVVETMQDGVIRVDRDDRILFINEAITLLLGYRQEEMLGQKAVDIIVDKNYKTFVKKKNKLVLKGTADRYVVEATTKTGKQVFLLVSAAPVYDQGGKIIGSVNILSDITEKTKYEEALKESEELFRKAFHTSPDSVNINRLEDGVYININKGFEMTTGYSANDVLGRSSLEINIWADPQERAELVEGLKKHGRVDNMEAKFRMKSGDIVRGLISASIIEINKVPHILSVARNIEDIKVAQDSLEASEASLSSIFKVAPIAIGLMAERIFKKVNNRMSEMTGYSQNELIGQSSRLLYETEEEYLRVGEIVYSNISQIGTGTLETKWKCKNGKIADIILNATQVDVEDFNKGFIFTALDITEQKRSKEALQEGEQRFRSIFESAISGIAFSDLKGSLILTNKAMEEIVGFSSAELDRMNFGDFTYKEDLQKEIMLLQELVENKRDEYRIEKRFVRKNKELVWVDISVSVIRDENGGPKFLVGIIQDINDKKIAEEKLREREEFLETLIENIPNMIFVKEAEDLKFIRFNKAGEELLGYSREEMIGKTDYDFFNKEEADNFTAKDREVLQKGEFLDVPEEIINTRFSGKRILHTKKIPLLNKTGKSGFLLGISEDITDNKKAEEALRESEHIFNAFMENNPIYVFFKDENIRSLKLSKNYEEMLGRPLNEILGKSMFELFPSDLAAKMVEDDKEILKNGRQVEIIEELGDRIYSTIKFPVKMDEEKAYLAGYTIDITDRAKAEKALKQSEEQYRALAAKQLNIREEERIHIARELHDHLGQGLTGLKMDISWMVNKLMAGELDKAGPELREKAKSIIELIDENIKAVRKMSTKLRPNVLDYLGLEAAIEWQLNEFKTRSGISCQLKSGIKSLQLDSVYSTNIFRIFQEILTNILRHANAGKVKVKLEMNNNDLIVKVADDGVGIANNKMVNINSLGLLGMKERASIMNGKILFESPAKGGTTVTLSVPINGGTK